MTYTCQNCDFKTDDEFALVPIEEMDELTQRISPGEPVPAGECPKCGAVCHEEKPTPKLVITVSGGNIQGMCANVPLGIDIVVIDFDNMKAECEEIADQADEIHELATADCPLSIMWDDHNAYVVDTCDDCGVELEPEATMNCPDGATICRSCFDQGGH